MVASSCNDLLLEERGQGVITIAPKCNSTSSLDFWPGQPVSRKSLTCASSTSLGTFLVGPYQSTIQFPSLEDRPSLPPLVLTSSLADLV